MIYTLENSKVSLSFDTCTCSIVSLINKISGDQYIKVKTGTALFSLSCLDKKGGMSKVYPEDVQDVTISNCGGCRNMAIIFDVQGILIETVFMLSDDSDSIECRIKITNNGDIDINEVLFPRVRGIYLGHTWEDDCIVLPHHAGEKTQNPAEEYLKPEFTGMWRAGTEKDEEVYFRELSYCGLASMMWMYYYDDNNGFYISSYDSSFLMTGLRAETGSLDRHYMGFAMRKYLTIKNGGTWESEPYIISANCSDWHRGAAEYRGWIEKYIKMPPNPKYLKDQCVLMNMYNFRREGTIYTKFSAIPSLYDRVRELGINHFFMASWNRQGFDQNYPEYYPDLELGTSMDLYNGCKYINDNGGIPTFYINARIFDINSDYHETMGKRMAIKLHDGSMVDEQYGEYKFTVSCPSDAEWQKYIIDTACWMVKSYDAKGIYLDQLGSAEPFPCYDKSHTHEDTGLFNQGYLKVLRELKDKLTELNRDCFLMIENCGDIYGPHVWGNLTWNGEVRDEFFNLYKYTFPEYVQVNMINPKTTGDKAYRKEQYYRDVERALVLGSILWVNPLFKFDEGDGEMLCYLKDAISFRKQVNPYIISSKYVDTDGIINISGDIKVSRWVSGDSDLYIIGNNSGTGGSFEIPVGDFELEAYTITKGSIEPVLETSCGRKKIYAPPDRVSYILLKKKMKTGDGSLPFSTNQTENAI
jgi:hypothetical protein